MLSLIALLSLVACDFEPTETFVPDIESTSTDLSIGATTVEVTPGSVIKLTTGDAVMLTLSAGGNVGDGGSVGDEGVGSVIPVHIEAFKENRTRVTVLSTASFDATRIDSRSLRLGTPGGQQAGVMTYTSTKGNLEYMQTPTDVNGDGRVDMYYFFSNNDLSANGAPVGDRSSFVLTGTHPSVGSFEGRMGGASQRNVSASLDGGIVANVAGGSAIPVQIEEFKENRTRVTVLSAPSFDATRIDSRSLRLVTPAGRQAGVMTYTSTKGNLEYMQSPTDVNGDGLVDMYYWFSNNDLSSNGAVGDRSSFVLTGTHAVAGAFEGRVDGSHHNVSPGGSTVWTSSQPSVVTIDASGRALARSPGSSQITGTSGSLTVSATINVEPRPSTPPPTNNTVLKAFPEAEGWGANALDRCDRSAVQVHRVTNLNDSGSGSLRDAIARATGGRLNVVVFDVAGIIQLNSRIEIRNNCLYVAGQTAPGSGITIRAPDRTAFFTRRTSHDLVFRYLRIRNGTERPGQNTDGAIGFILGGGNSIILDHLSFSWASDQLLSIYQYADGVTQPINRVTVQRSIFAQPFRSSPVCYSIKGEVNGDEHGVPGWYRVKEVSLHHNAAIHCSHRAPMLAAGSAEVINSVVYNWNQGAMHTEGRKPAIDYVNNYLKAGPTTRTNVDYGSEFSHAFRFNAPGGWSGREPNDYVVIGNAFRTHDGRTGPSLYLSGNIGPNNPSGGADNWVMTSKYKNDNNTYPESVSSRVEYPSGGGMPLRVNDVLLRRTSRLPQPPHPVNVQSAEAAWRSLIVDGDIGANRRLACGGGWVDNADSVDQRFLADAREGRNAPWPGDEREVGGYPRIDSGTRCVDSDGDGMPDEFERRYGLNPNDPRDASQDKNGNGYTNLEEYLNGRSPN